MEITVNTAAGLEAGIAAIKFRPHIPGNVDYNALSFSETAVKKSYRPTGNHRPHNLVHK